MEMENSVRPGGFRNLWLAWVMGNTTAWIVGMGSAWLISELVAPLLAGRSLVAFWAVAGMIVGVCFGTTAWFFFRSLEHPALKARSRLWFIANILGWGLALETVVGLGLGRNLDFAPVGLILGTLSALPQWFALRGAVRHAWVWIPAQAIGWLAGLYMPDVLGIAAGFAVAGTVSGAIGGAALVWLIRTQR